MTTFYLKVAKYLDDNPMIVHNLKQFRALILDLTENDIPLTNLLITATIDGLHFKISKLKKTQRKEIINLIHSFVIRYSIDPKCEDDLFTFYANVFAERNIPEIEQAKEDKIDPIVNLNLSTKFLKEPPKQIKFYTPCGVNKQDFGFQVKGLKEHEKCTNKFASIYSIILGILQRSITIDKTQSVLEYESKLRHEINFSNVFRLEIILLLLIKNNYDNENTLKVSFDGDKDDLLCAVNEINHHANILASLSLVEYKNFEIIFDENGLKLSTKESTGDVQFVNAQERKTISRIDWIENSLIYSISKKNDKNLDILLSEIFMYEKFLPGQKECLVKILNENDKSSITILPVGGGKSLIYYFLAYLKSCPTYVVTPTVFLIADQLRNLKLFHNIDDAIQISFDMNFKNFVPTNKLIYVTPKTFLNRELLCRLIKFNYRQQIGNIILDEVHCISNWGHDFKPEYLMLSYNLNEFLSNQKYYGFTGTANYKVIKDIKEQLNIDIESIYCPIALKNTIFNFNYVAKDTKEEILEEASKKLEIDSKDESQKRTIVFSRSQTDGAHLFTSLTNEAKENVDLTNGLFSSYHDFIKGNTNALICGELFGIGINLPRINNIIHLYSPLSKSQYVQEIGRAARNKGTSSSNIYFLPKDSFKGLNAKIIDKSIPTDKLIDLFANEAFTDEGEAIISKLFGNIESQTTFKENILSLAKTIHRINKEGRISFKIEENKNFNQEINRISRYLYVLFRVGYIYGWYFEKIDEVNRLITYYIDPGKEQPTLDNVITATVGYLNSMGEHKNTILKIKHSRSIEKIIEIYIDWYYTQLLYYHREQYIEMLDFLEKYQNKSSKLISSEINHYFSLSLLNVQNNSENTKKLSIQEIFNLASSTQDKKILEGIKASIENEYSQKLDLFILINNLTIFKDLDLDRLKRILDNSTEEEQNEILFNISTIYDKFNLGQRLEIVSSLVKYFSLEKILTTIYDNVEKDETYYYILSSILNSAF